MIGDARCGHGGGVLRVMMGIACFCIVDCLLPVVFGVVSGREWTWECVKGNHL